MENASKALIIAGAILIAIVLITLGVVILGQGQDVVNNSNMDEQVVSTWNQKFTQYAGDKVAGTNVNALMNAVVSSNLISNRDGNLNKMIKIIPAGSTNKVGVSNTFTGLDTNSKNAANWGTSSITTKAKTGANYKVVVAYNKDGYVSTITITSNT